MAIWIDCTAKVDNKEVPAIYRPNNQTDIPFEGEKRFVSVKLGNEWVKLQIPVELTKVGPLQWDW